MTRTYETVWVNVTNKSALIFRQAKDLNNEPLNSLYSVKVKIPWLRTGYVIRAMCKQAM